MVEEVCLQLINIFRDSFLLGCISCYLSAYYELYFFSLTLINTLIYYARKVPTKGNDVKVEYNNSTSSEHFEFKDAKEDIKGGRLDELYSVIQPRLPRTVTAAALVRKKAMASIRRQLPTESKWARQSWPRPRQLMIRLISLLR